MSDSIMQAAMQHRRKPLPDTRLVATVLHGRTEISWELHQHPGMPSLQVADMHGAPAGYRADQASIGERLSAVSGRRLMKSKGDA
jgi:hypothetical protein